MVSSGGVVGAVTELVVSVAVSVEGVEMSLAPGAGAGGGAFPSDEAVNIQPPASPAKAVSDVIINAACHLFLFMFALCIM